MYNKWKIALTNAYNSMFEERGEKMRNSNKTFSQSGDLPHKGLNDSQSALEEEDVIKQ